MVVIYKGGSATITASEGMWITSYHDGDDVYYYTSEKTVRCTRGRVKAYREITDEQNEEYLAMREMARAEVESNEGEEQPMP